MCLCWYKGISGCDTEVTVCPIDSQSCCEKARLRLQPLFVYNHLSTHGSTGAQFGVCLRGTYSLEQQQTSVSIIPILNWWSVHQWHSLLDSTWYIVEPVNGNMTSPGNAKMCSSTVTSKHWHLHMDYLWLICEDWSADQFVILLSFFMTKAFFFNWNFWAQVLWKQH